MKIINSKGSNFLFRLRYYGLLLIVIALVLSILYISIDLRIEVKTLALNSTFFESNWLAIIQTNIVEEIMMILYIVGLNLIIWSIYKTAPKDQYQYLIKIAIRTIWVVTILQILSIILLYGLGFVLYLTYNLIAYQAVFLVFYYIGKKKNQELE